MVGLIFIGNIEYCPYLSKYTEILEQQKMEYKILFWDRENAVYDDNRYLVYHKELFADIHPVFKLKDFIQYRKWLHRKIKEWKLNLFILLDTMSAMLLSSYLLKNARGRYLCDVRDYSYEKLRLFKKRESRLFKAAFHVYISSCGFLSFLPKEVKYINTHNFLEEDVKKCEGRKFTKKGINNTLNVVWIGAIRYFDHQIKLIQRLCEDSRFHIIYHGSGPDYKRLLLWAEENKIANLKFTGKYKNSDKYNLLEEADILINNYDIGVGFEVKYAISNKFYDGLIYRIPQVVETETYKAEKMKELKTGIALSVDNERFADELYAFYYNLDADVFNRICEKEVERIINEEKNYIDSIKQFLKEKKGEL